MRSVFFLACLFCICTGCSKSDNKIAKTLPVLAIENLTQVRSSISATTFHFAIDVYPASSKDITVNYATDDSTALNGVDYTAVSGTLTIPANQLSGYIDVVVSADSLRQNDQVFIMKLSSPVNATLSDSQATGTIQNLGTYLPIDNTGYTSASSYSGMTLVWSDEFNGKTLNTSNWTYETGNSGWGNNELEYYTNSQKNTFLTGGYLVIEARSESMGTSNYTSARIKTEDKKTFTYGRIDIRAKLPEGQGLWPALWMLGNNINSVGWPTCGEIDIMELLGQNTSTIYGSYHWENQGSEGNASESYSLSSGRFSDSFHVFSLQWDSTKMAIMVDDFTYATVNRSDVTGTSYPFDQPFFFVFNVAVGGSWPGSPNSSTVFPQRMIVDYIRVFQ